MDKDEALKAQNQEIERIAASPLIVATFLKKEGKHVYIMEGETCLRVEAPRFKLNPGDSVLLYRDTYQIVEKGIGDFYGRVSSVKEITPDGTIFVDDNGQSNAVISAISVKKGDRVLLDKSSSIIVKNLGGGVTEYTPLEIPNVTWDDIGGQESAKREMIEAVELPHKHKEIFSHYGKKPSKGVLLYGEPGNGKTMLGKAAANSLSKIYNSPSGFMYIKGPEIMDKFFGESEAKVRSIFRNARDHHAMYNSPCVIFIDEADAILGARGERRFGMMDTIVTMFLTEMDGMDESHAIVILATNRPEMLDPAVVRDGRIDRKVCVHRPNLAEAEIIFGLNLRKIPFDKKYKSAAKDAAEYLFKQECVSNVSGAMISGIVDRAISVALRRDILSGKPSFLCMDDIGMAIDELEQQECFSDKRAA